LQHWKLGLVHSYKPTFMWYVSLLTVYEEDQVLLVGIKHLLLCTAYNKRTIR